MSKLYLKNMSNQIDAITQLPIKMVIDACENFINNYNQSCDNYVNIEGMLKQTVVKRKTFFCDEVTEFDRLMDKYGYFTTSQQAIAKEYPSTRLYVSNYEKYNNVVELLNQCILVEDIVEHVSCNTKTASFVYDWKTNS